MSDDRKTKWHGKGIYSRHSKRLNRPVYFIQYYWNGKRPTETVPHEYRRETGRLEGRAKTLSGLDAARALRADREVQRYRVDWAPPKVQRERAEAERARGLALGEALAFEEAWKRFKSEHGQDYSRPASLGPVFNALSRFFAGRRLDEVTRVDVRRYYVERLTNAGSFEIWPRTVGRQF